MDTADHRPTSLPPPPAVPYAEASTPNSGHDPSCSSSDSDTDTDDDFFQIDAPELAHSSPDPLIEIIPRNLDDFRLAINTDEISLLAKSLGSRSEERLPPAVQVMARNEATDLGRIPSSVFARSSPTPVEWSVASNESLFSIHMGNSSFSRDHMFLMGRSGELGGFTSGLIEYPLPSMSPAVRLVGPPGGNWRGGMVDLGKIEEAAASANAEAMRDVMRAAAEKEREREKPPSEPLGRCISRHSDGSNTSFSSFAFPILTGDGRIGSTKVDSMLHVDRHPLSPETPLKADAVPASSTAAAATTTPPPASSQVPAPTSIQSLRFPCFSCCRFCC